MKVRSALFMIALAGTLAACNFTLAEDITPPPDYIPPTPAPTLGPLHPAAAPDVQNGAALFMDHCAACHGTTGLGDGPQSMQLPVTVPGIGLAEVARSASPAQWFKTVTQGNLDRFMPPFAAALTDKERWDVVAFALTLHTTSADLERGRSLVAADCAACAAEFSDQTKMAALSEVDLANVIRNGEGSVPAFGQDYSEEDARAAAAYLRSLTFAEPGALASAATPSAGTPQTGATQAAATEEAALGGIGRVHGTVDISGSEKATGLTVTLHAFDHGQDQSSGPQEVLTVTSKIKPDGSYAFEDVAMPLNRIFLAEVTYAGIDYRSDFDAVGVDTTDIQLPPLQLYDPSTDTSLLSIDQVHIYTDFATAGTVQVLEIFAFTNSSSNAVVISTDGASIPFIQLPAGALNPGYEAGQDSQPFAAADAGLAVVPSDKPYSIIAFFNLPYESSLDFEQPLVIDSPSVLLLVPDGIKVKGDQLSPRGPQVIQNSNYQEFAASDLAAGEKLTFTITGRPRASSATGLDAHQGWLIGGGAFGLALIVGGIYLYVRERRREPADVPEADFEDVDEVLDAILALDDLHRAGKISDEAHKARRLELKQILRDLR